MESDSIGRSPATVVIPSCLFTAPGSITATGTRSSRHSVAAIEDFRKSGLEHLGLSFRDVRLFKDDTPDLLLGQMRLFAREMMPRFRG